jgi:hypothetical protein
MPQIIYVAFEVEPAHGTPLTLRSPDGFVVKLTVDETRGRLLRRLGYDLSAGLDITGPGRVIGAVPVKARQPTLL